jgi:hypothetical protein
VDPGELKTTTARSGAPATSDRKLQLKGLGLKYQINKSLAVESDARIGPATGSPRAFIGVQKSFGAR